MIDPDDITRLLKNGAQCNTMGRAAGASTSAVAQSADVAQLADSAESAATLDPLDPRQRVAIELMFLGWHAGAIAMELNVSRSTVWRWKRDPRFTQLLREELDRHLGDIAGVGGDLLRQALIVARNTMLNGGDGALRASLAILRSGKAWNAIAQAGQAGQAGQARADQTKG